MLGSRDWGDSPARRFASQLHAARCGYPVALPLPVEGQHVLEPGQLKGALELSVPLRGEAG